MDKISSPLRYPGSKIKLAKYIKKVLDYNNFKPKILVEPFFGGGSISLNFLLNDWVDEIVISDKDRLIYGFWKTLFNNPKYLIEFVQNVDINITNFYKYKKMAIAKNVSSKKLAETCLFLNRTSFSGILCDNVGPIGGKDQKSDYKIDCRFKRKTLIKKIQRISQFKNRVTFVGRNWKKAIVYIESLNKKNKTLFYFDPPFYKKAQYLYRHYFTTKNHLDLSQAIKKLKSKWILSYDRRVEIKDMYTEYIQTSYAFPYSINSPARRIEKEYFITLFRKPPKSYLVKDNKG